VSSQYFNVNDNRILTTLDLRKRKGGGYFPGSPSTANLIPLYGIFHNLNSGVARSVRAESTNAKERTV
jgi:hypothetical protein